MTAAGSSFLAADANRFAGAANGGFNNAVAAAAPAVQPPPFSSLAQAKLDPRYRIGGTGEDLFSGNYNYSLPLVSLPGRAGLDLNITLSYNSLVWIKYGGTISYDYDYYPSLTPGFRIGFPEIEGPYSINYVNTYIVNLPSGRRVEMRQTASNRFEAVDSSYLYLTINSADPTQMTLYSMDGTQYKFELPNGNYPSRCTQIKDSNGNYISIAYKNIGDPEYPLTVIDKVTDTLGREIFFNYDGNLHLISITQNWNGQTFYWAQFDYGTKYVAPTFGSLYVDGPNNTDIPTITRVITGDGARHTFVYNSWGQAEDIWTYGEADNPRAAMDYVFPAPNTASPQSDCPRFTQRNDYIVNWAGATGNGWVSSQFSFDQYETYGQVTDPDGVTHKEIFSTAGGTRGLTTRTETHHGGAIQQFTDITWASDSTTSPPLRPRVTETKICDDRNHNGAYNSGTDKLRKTTIEYTTVGSTIRLPWVVREYNEGGGSVYRSTQTEYVASSNYINNSTTGTRRIIGLPSFKYFYEGDQATLKAQTEYVYDSTDSGFLQAHSSAPRQHDAANYGTSFSYRGNLTKVRRYSVDGQGMASSPIETETGYHITGTVAWAKDGEDHQTTISYDDSFLHYTEPSPGTLSVVTVPPSPATFAYPTKVTIDETPADLYSTISYNYDFGAVTRTVDPKAFAAGGQNPQTMSVNAYDSKGRLDKSLVWKAGAKHSHTRYVYGNDHNWMQTFTTVNSLAEETHVTHLLDGIGRERITISEHPGSVGTLRSRYQVFDKMGRVVEWSNPTEIDGNWAPSGDDGGGYAYSSQAYDWKGRPTITTNQDRATTKQAQYDGCGCGRVNTITKTDEVGRKQKDYYDVHGTQIRRQMRHETVF